MRNQQKIEANDIKEKIQKKPNSVEKFLSYKDFKKMHN